MPALGPWLNVFDRFYELTDSRGSGRVDHPSERGGRLRSGTQPAAYCRVHGGRPGSTPLLTTVAGWETDPPKEPLPAGAVAQVRPSPTAEPAPARPHTITKAVPVEPPGEKPATDEAGKRKGFFRRILDVLK